MVLSLVTAGYLLAGAIIGGIFMNVTETEPEKWSPKQHQKVMYECKKMCGQKKVKFYDSKSGECGCYK